MHLDGAGSIGFFGAGIVNNSASVQTFNAGGINGGDRHILGLSIQQFRDGGLMLSSR